MDHNRCSSSSARRTRRHGKGEDEDAYFQKFLCPSTCAAYIISARLQIRPGFLAYSSLPFVGSVGDGLDRKVATGVAESGQTHPVPDIEVTGGAVQYALAVQGWTLVAGGCFFSALTNTGITAPVFRLNARWPTTRRMLAISPE